MSGTLRAKQVRTRARSRERINISIHRRNGKEYESDFRELAKVPVVPARPVGERRGSLAMALIVHNHPKLIALRVLLLHLTEANFCRSNFKPCTSKRP